MAKRKRKKNKNIILQYIAENDPTRFKTDTVKPEKGKGRKDRPRTKTVDPHDVGLFYLSRFKHEGTSLF